MSSISKSPIKFLKRIKEYPINPTRVRLSLRPLAAMNRQNIDPISTLAQLRHASPDFTNDLTGQVILHEEKIEI